MLEISCDPKQVLNTFNRFLLIQKKGGGLIILYIIKKFLANEVPGTQRVFFSSPLRATLPLFPPQKKKEGLVFTESGLNLARSQH